MGSYLKRSFVCAPGRFKIPKLTWGSALVSLCVHAVLIAALGSAVIISNAAAKSNQIQSDPLNEVKTGSTAKANSRGSGNKTVLANDDGSIPLNAITADKIQLAAVTSAMMDRMIMGTADAPSKMKENISQAKATLKRGVGQSGKGQTAGGPQVVIGPNNIDFVRSAVSQLMQNDIKKYSAESTADKIASGSTGNTGSIWSITTGFQDAIYAFIMKGAVGFGSIATWALTFLTSVLIYGNMFILIVTSPLLLSMNEKYEGAFWNALKGMVMTSLLPGICVLVNTVLWGAVVDPLAKTTAFRTLNMSLLYTPLICVMIVYPIIVWLIAFEAA